MNDSQILETSLDRLCYSLGTFSAFSVLSGVLLASFFLDSQYLSFISLPKIMKVSRHYQSTINQPSTTQPSTNHHQSAIKQPSTTNQPSNHGPTHFGTTHETPRRPSGHRLWTPQPALPAPPGPSPTRARSLLRPPRRSCREGGWGSCRPATCD